MAAWYRTGTIAVTNGSTTATGTGTAFNSNVNINDAFWGPDGKPYEIAAIVSDTVLTLATAYLGSTASGQTYQIQPTRGVTVSQRDAVQSLIEDYEDVVIGAGAGNFPAGTAATPSVRGFSDTNTGLNFPGGDALSLVTGGATRATITANGLGIGDVTPDFPIHITSADPAIKLEHTTGANAKISSNFKGGIVLDLDPENTAAATSFEIEMDGSTAALLTYFGWAVPGVYGGASSGSFLLCGGANNLNDGTNLALYGSTHAKAGDILFRASTANTFQYDHSSATYYFYDGAGTPSLYINATSLFAQVDGAIALGNGSKRFGQIYSTVGTISTSDERLKTEVVGLSPAHDAAADVILDGIGEFQYLNSVEEKGGAARRHIGVTVQGMIAALEAEGIDPFAYGFICYDEWDETPATEDVYGDDPAWIEEGRPGETAPQILLEKGQPGTPAGNRYSARYDQIAMYLLSALNARTKDLEARLAALESA